MVSLSLDTAPQTLLRTKLVAIFTFCLLPKGSGNSVYFVTVIHYLVHGVVAIILTCLKMTMRQIIKRTNVQTRYIACYALLLILPLCSLQATAQNVTIQKPSAYKTSWQRLLLQLSQAFFTAAKENQINLDSSLIHCANSLKLSRLPIIAEGIDIQDLAGQLNWVDKRAPQEGKTLLSKLTGRKHLKMVLFLGAYYAFEPENYSRYKDSVIYFLNLAINEGKKLNQAQLVSQAELLIAKTYVDGYDFQHGDPMFDKLIKDCQRTGDGVTEAKVWFYRGLYTGLTPVTVTKRIEYLQKAKQLYHIQRNTEGEIACLFDISYLNVPIGQLVEANKAARESLALAESIHFPFTYYNTDALCMISIFAGKFGEPLKYGFETIRNAEISRDSIGLGYFYERVGLLYFIEDTKSENARKWFTKAINTIMNVNHDNGLYLPLNTLITSYVSTGNDKEAWNLFLSVSKRTPPQTITDKFFYYFTKGTLHLISHEFESAEKSIIKADSLAKQMALNGFGFRQDLIVVQYGELNYLKGNYTLARKFFEESITQGRMSGGTLRNELNVVDRLIRLDSIEKNNELAVIHLKLYRKLADSNYTISKIRQAEELQVKYATAEKENQITLLNQNEKLRQNKLNKLTLIKNTTIAGIILVAIIAGLLYRQARLRRRNNELITHKNELLEKLLTEKEWLLKEVHHRVKNNLHTVICLLESQAAYLENDALKAIENSRHRIYAMSLIHQKLYQSDDIKTVDMALYLTEFVMYINDSFGTAGKVRFNLDIEPLKLGVAYAVPLSLIINEAITNSIKYAFPQTEAGLISISLKAEKGQVTLIIADNGIGIDTAQMNKKTSSLGLKLLRGLSEDIKADLVIESKNGTIITIRFKVDQLIQPVLAIK